MHFFSFFILEVGKVGGVAAIFRGALGCGTLMLCAEGAPHPPRSEHLSLLAPPKFENHITPSSKHPKNTSHPLAPPKFVSASVGVEGVAACAPRSPICYCSAVG